MSGDQPFDLYEALGLPKHPQGKKCSRQQIKKAYFAKALQYHPDKNPHDQSSKDKFQQIQLAYSVLSDENKRIVYDSTGRLSDAVDSADGEISVDRNNLLAMYQKISVEDILKFEGQYKGSQEELDDLKQAYEECRGDMQMILERVPLSGVDDEDRFKQIVEDWIAKKQAKSYREFKLTTTEKQRSKRRREAELEAKEARELVKELGLEQEFSSSKTGDNQDNDNNNEKDGDIDPALRALIQRKGGQRRFDAVIEGLEAKYAKKSNSNATKKRQKQ